MLHVLGVVDHVQSIIEDEVVEIEPPVKDMSTIADSVKQCIDYCHERNIQDPVEILRVAQKFIVTGRQLEVTDPSVCLEGETNYILVNRQDVLKSAMEEINPLVNPRLTLEVFSGLLYLILYIITFKVFSCQLVNSYF